MLLVRVGLLVSSGLRFFFQFLDSDDPIQRELSEFVFVHGSGCVLFWVRLLVYTCGTWWREYMKVLDSNRYGRQNVVSKRR